MRVKSYAGNLPRLPDETIYSWLTRLIYASGMSILEFRRRYLGMYDFRRINRIPSVFLETTEAEMTENYQFYLSCLSQDKQKEFLGSLKRNERNCLQRIPIRDGLTARKKYPMYCPECLSADTDRYGIPYFHITHQTEGVWACPIHDVKLIPYDSEPFGVLLFDHGVKPETADPLERKVAHKLADFSRLDRDMLTRGYLLAFEDLGLKTKGKRQEGLDLERLYGLIKKSVGEDYLSHHGLNLSKKDLTSRDNWLRRIIGLSSACRESVNTPFEHLLIWSVFNLNREHFLNAEEETAQREYRRKHRQCLNGYCRGEALLYNRRWGVDYFHCPECGLVFTENGYRINVGRTLVPLILADIKSGLTLTEIERRSGIKRQNIQSILTQIV